MERKKADSIVTATPAQPRTNQDSEDDLRLIKWKQLSQMFIAFRIRTEEEIARGQKMTPVLDPDNNNHPKTKRGNQDTFYAGMAAAKKRR